MLHEFFAGGVEFFLVFLFQCLQFGEGGGFFFGEYAGYFIETGCQRSLPGSPGIVLAVAVGYLAEVAYAAGRDDERLAGNRGGAFLIAIDIRDISLASGGM